LQIYQTALIPQASSTLNSSRTAYQAGRTNFLELLDSERSLYETRIAYYRNLAQYVDNLARLEEMAGTSLSTLPFGDSQ
jgi:outer membrane protein TolC